MANVDMPRGFWPLYSKNGGEIRCSRYVILNTDATLMTKGDVADLSDDGTVILGAADCGVSAIGIFSYFEYVDANGKFQTSKQIPATKTGFTKLYAFIWDDPSIVFGVQTDSGTSLVLADVGELGDHVATAADTTRKLSGHELDSSDIQAAGGTQFKLLGKIDEPNNAWGEHVNVKVMFNQHHLLGAEGSAI